ncbi:alpha-beta hydrolase superfamily lysophospholipase [Nocardia transvalensis]|uniref:Alpha-beta hydrolase superfamily lysophospholipase n=1 Tax=Nocardia transvalensis TaxID=37333 RepID=A0A7W9PDA9_9NOCA|nr:lipase family protein [Nocardia transvalensis]MBB5914022.1 alpha-beta hydrolase superfamily lysophospholipase [Nocardia transvalensis]
MAVVGVIEKVGAAARFGIAAAAVVLERFGGRTETAPVARLSGGRPLLPSQDPFLRPPADLADYAPGTIVRSRTVELGLLGVVPQQVRAWQLVYRSTDLHGRPEVAITTTLLPAGDPGPGERPLLAFQSAIDAVTERCAPSYALRRGAWVPGSITQLEYLLVANALRRGWAVTIADHGGPNGHFGAPREPGYRSLDGVRAALRFGPLGLHALTPVAVWGYSGGGMASSWLVEMAPTYAPELDIVGAVLGAPVGDPGQVFVRLNGGRYAGFPAIVIAALHRIYPALGQVLEEQLNPEGRRLVDRAARLAPIVALAVLSRHNVSDYLTRPLEEILAEPPMRAMLDDLRLGTAAPHCPVLVTQPLHDRIIHVDGVEEQVGRYRRGGATVTYIRDRASDHFSLLPLATPLSLNWLADRIAGIPVTDTTSRTVRSVVASRAGLLGLLEMAGTATRVVLGRPLRQRPAPPPRHTDTLAA